MGRTPYRRSQSWSPAGNFPEGGTARTIKLTTVGNSFSLKQPMTSSISNFVREIPLLTLRVHIIATFDRIMLEFNLG